MECSLLGRAIHKLSKREQTIICLRFGLNQPDGKEKTQKEVADLLGISQFLYFQAGKTDHAAAEKRDCTV